MIAVNTLFLLGGLLLLLGVLASTISARLGVPLLLLFLGLGVLAGEDGLGGIEFDDFDLAYLIGNLALAVILLDGGLRTKISSFRAALKPAGMLATLGVAITAGLVGIFATSLLDIDWRYGLLLGAIVGSTDAAAVFNLLRNSGITLNERVGATLEIESGTNDPMAIFLVTLLMELVSAPGSLTAADMIMRFLQQFGIGALVGIVAGYGLVKLMTRIRLVEGLYALLIISAGLVIFGAVNELGGSGFLAIYLVGLCVGNARTRSAEPVLQVMDGLAWLAQAVMFLVLGLLVSPSHLWTMMLPAFAIATFLMLVARPAAVFLSLLPFRLPWRERVFISWVGLRGAVPIVLAVFPVTAGLPHSILLFDVAFVVVCISLLIQGSTVSVTANWLGVRVPGAATPVESHRLWVGRESSLELSAFRVEEGSPAEAKSLGTLGALGGSQQCVLLIRDDHRLPPDPDLNLQAGDEVWLLLQTDEIESVSPFFSHAEMQGALASHNFFGEFIIDAHSAASDLAMLYGLKLTEQEQEQSIAQMLSVRLGKKLVVGDRITLGSVRLTVRAIRGDEVSSVGLKILHQPGPI